MHQPSGAEHYQSQHPADRPTHPLFAFSARSNWFRHACLGTALADPFQLQLDVVRSLEAFFGIFRETRPDHMVEGGWNQWLKRRYRLWIFFENRRCH